jgi:hypothetical protein
MAAQVVVIYVKTVGVTADAAPCGDKGCIFRRCQAVAPGCSCPGASQAPVSGSERCLAAITAKPLTEEEIPTSVSSSGELVQALTAVILADLGADIASTP